jgi:hypothetical protein
VQLHDDRRRVHLGDASDEVRRFGRHRCAGILIGNAGRADKIHAFIVGPHRRDEVMQATLANLGIEQGLKFSGFVGHGFAFHFLYSFNQTQQTRRKVSA